jgi:hypothetical protein
MHHVEFRGPVVVVIARLPETNAVVFGLSGQRGSDPAAFTDPDRFRRSFLVAYVRG